MNKLISLCFFIIITNYAYAQDSIIFNDFDKFFKTYIENGKVNYQTIKGDVFLLNSIIEKIEKIYLKNFSPSQQKAFWINSYNILVIKQVVDRYPVKSPRDVTGFFDRIKQNVANEKLTLNEIENEKLRNVFHDFRLHFVLICGAKSCPPIANFAYKAEELEKQLNAQTSLVMQDTAFIKLSSEKKQVSVSEIFKWYESEFNTSADSTIAFINMYRNEKIPAGYHLTFYTYDWSLNENETITENKKAVIGTQAYSPSVLLKKNQWEFKLFNNLYTQTASYGSDKKRNEYLMRSTYFTSINQFLAGVSSKINIGIDVWIRSVRIDSKNSSAFSLFKFENSTSSRTAITNAGPKIKFVPFKKLRRLSIQATLLFPIASNQEGTTNSKPYLSADGYFLITQIFYDQPVNSKLQLFFQLAPWLSINRKFNSESISIATPVSVFLSYFPTNRVTFYMQNEFWPSYDKAGISSYFLQQGLGIKYQLIKGFMELESAYTRFTSGRNAGAGETYNFGIRIIH